MIIDLREPSEEEYRFATYLHYVDSLRNLITYYHNPLGALLMLCRDSTHFAHIQRNTSADIARIALKLRNAWSTELSLRFTGLLGNGLVRYANHWAPVQTYYSAYLAAQGFFLACNRSESRSHSSGLSQLAADIGDGRLIMPAPLSALSISTTITDTTGFSEVPTNITITPVSSIAHTSSNNWWNLYALALRTTRERLLEERVDQWRRQNKTAGGKPRKNVPASVRSDQDTALRPVSIFDFLYRMRIRSNYRDADTFLEQRVSDQEAAQFNTALLDIEYTLLLVLEAHIRQHIGRDAYANIVQDFVAKVPDIVETIPVEQRLQLIEQYC